MLLLHLAGLLAHAYIRLMRAALVIAACLQVSTHC